MSTTLNASTSSGLVQSADTSGTLELQSNGTTQLTVASTGAYGTLKSGTAVSASSTSVDFTSIPSWAKRITVMFQGVSTSGTSNILVQLGAGSVTSTGYISTSMYTSSAALQAVSATTGFVLGQISATSILSGLIQINTLGSNVWVASGHLKTSTAQTSSTAGDISLGGTLDRIRITTANGTDTFDAGTINIIYEG